MTPVEAEFEVAPETAVATVAAGSVLDASTADFESGLQRRGDNRKSLMVWLRGALVEGTDFGTIKGNKSLWKPGAEKVLGMLNCTAEFPTLQQYEDLAIEGKEIQTIILRCSIKNADGQVIANGVGARTLRQDGGDLNKCLKMAKKSALIDGTLAAGGLSEIFTQDIEDMDAAPSGRGFLSGPTGNVEMASEKQKGFIRKLLKSSVITKDERTKTLGSLDRLTVERATQTIDNLKTEVENRKAAAKSDKEILNTYGNRGFEANKTKKKSEEADDSILGSVALESYIHIAKDLGIPVIELEEKMKELWGPRVDLFPIDMKTKNADFAQFPSDLAGELDAFLEERREE